MTGGYYLEQIIGSPEGSRRSRARSSTRRAATSSTSSARSGRCRPCASAASRTALLPVMSLDLLAASPAGSDRFVRSARRPARGVARGARRRVPRLRPGRTRRTRSSRSCACSRRRSGYRARLAFDRAVLRARRRVLASQLEPAPPRARERCCATGCGRSTAERLLLERALLRPDPGGRLAAAARAARDRGDERRAQPLAANYIAFLRTATFDDLLAERLPVGFPPAEQLDALLYLLLRHSVLLAYGDVARRILVRRGALPDAPYREPALVDIVGGAVPERTPTLSARCSSRSGAAGDHPHARRGAGARGGGARRAAREPRTTSRRCRSTCSSASSRGCLDLFSYRLDAWITSLATRRLSELRRQTPRGLVLGGFGWVHDLQGLAAVDAPPRRQGETAAALRGARARRRDPRAVDGAGLGRGGAAQRLPGAARARRRAAVRDRPLLGARAAGAVAARRRARGPAARRAARLPLRARPARARARPLHRRLPARSRCWRRSTGREERARRGAARRRASRTRAAGRRCRTRSRQRSNAVRTRLERPPTATAEASSALAAASVADGLALVAAAPRPGVPFDRARRPARRRPRRSSRPSCAALDAGASTRSATRSPPRASTSSCAGTRRARRRASTRSRTARSSRPSSRSPRRRGRARRSRTGSSSLFSGRAAPAPPGVRAARARGGAGARRVARQMVGDPRRVAAAPSSSTPTGTVLAASDAAARRARRSRSLDALYLRASASPDLPSDLERLLEHVLPAARRRPIPADARVRLDRERDAGVAGAELGLGEFLELNAAFRAGDPRRARARRAATSREAAARSRPPPTRAELGTRADRAVAALRRRATGLARAASRQPTPAPLRDAARRPRLPRHPRGGPGLGARRRRRRSLAPGAHGRGGGDPPARPGRGARGGFDRGGRDAGGARRARAGAARGRLRPRLPRAAARAPGERRRARRRLRPLGQAARRRPAAGALVAAGREPRAPRRVAARGARSRTRPRSGAVGARAQGRAAAVRRRRALGRRCRPTAAAELPPGKLSLVAHLPQPFRPAQPLAGLVSTSGSRSCRRAR